MSTKTVDFPVSLEHFSIEKLISSLILVASEKKFSFACWRLPNTTDFVFLVDFSKTLQKGNVLLEKAQQGFLVQPFIRDNNSESSFLNADFVFFAKTKKIRFSSTIENPIAKDQFIKEFIEMLSSDKNAIIGLPEYTKGDNSNATIDYKQLVQKAKELIIAQKFKKIVLARSKEIQTRLDLNALSSILWKVGARYENSFVSLVYTQESGYWLTATPEILVGIDSNGIFRTTALAGTQEVMEGDTLPKATWTQKEIEEQALVSRYIVNCFKQIRLREFEEDGPRTVRSGNLFHLRTDFSVDMKALNISELGTMMLDLLHPTSAVCGMPKEITLDFIKEHEQLDRKLFSGYIGPVNIEESTSLFVNLRCANLFSNKAILYSGAGITQDSEPEKEFNETEVKMEVVGRFLRPENF